MSEFYWFRMLIRLVGVLLLGMSVPTFLFSLGNAIMYFIPGTPMYSSGSSRFAVTMIPAILAYGAQAAFGAYLLLKGDWLIRRIVSEVHSRCVVCGYDLRGMARESCPECNTPIKAATPAGVGASLSDRETVP